MNVGWLVVALMCFGGAYIAYLGKKAWKIAYEDQDSGGSEP